MRNDKVINLWVHEGEGKLGSELASKGAEVELHLYLGSNISLLFHFTSFFLFSAFTLISFINFWLFYNPFNYISS